MRLRYAVIRFINENIYGSLAVWIGFRTTIEVYQ
jgi:hypothetical protein